MRKFTTLFLVVLFGLHWSSNAQTFTFTCPTTTTTWIVPAGVTSILVDVTGATGGRNSVDAVPYLGYTLVHRGGNGARVQATLAVTPGQVLNIYVGGAPAPAVTGATTIGGFNGGGNSNFAPGAALTPNISGGGGGGASDIRIGGTALGNRVVVAGGGGGAGGNYPTPPNNYDRGGDGGGLTGEAGSDGGTVGTASTGRGGTAAAGGAGGTGGGAAGTLGVGGNGANSTAGGGGGGGYYGGGGSYWAGGGGGSSYTDATISTAVTHTRGYNSLGCGSVVITIPCTTPAVSGVTSLCAGATTTLSSTTAGGVWTSGTTTVATVNPSSGVVTGVSGGTSMITYTVAGGCFITTLVTVTGLPATGTITGTASVCPTTTTQLSDPIPGGVWSSVSTGVATISSTGLVTGVSAGTSIISYTVTGSCGIDAATISVTVNPDPVAGVITGILDVCAPATRQLSSSVSSGVWSSVSTGVATISPTGLVTGVTIGTSVISYSVTNGCGTAAATALFTVSPPNAGVITGMTTVCPMGTTQLTDPVAGGVWSSVSTAVATVDAATGQVTGVSIGTSVISYSVTNSCGTAYAITLITVSPQNAGTITGVTSICPGTTSQLTDLAPGGIWSSASPGVAAIDGIGRVTGVNVGTSVISYTISNSCGTVVATTLLTVNPFPVAGSITGPTRVCLPATISLSNSATGGVWSSAPASVATVSTSGVVTGGVVGNATITYRVTNSCGTAVTTSTITVVNTATAGTIVGGTKVCIGDMLQLSNAIAGGEWGTTAAPIASIDIATGQLLGIGEGVAAITYLIPYCSFPYTTEHVTVYAPPPAPVIVGSGAAMSTTAGYASYQWLLDGVAISGATNFSYTAPNTGSYSVVVRNEGDCETTSDARVIATVGIGNVNGSDVDIEIYPNPTSNLLMISSSEKVDISILGVDGKELITQKDAAQTDVSKLVPGLYMIRIYGKDGRLVKVATFVKG